MTGHYGAKSFSESADSSAGRKVVPRRWFGSGYVRGLKLRSHTSAESVQRPDSAGSQGPHMTGLPDTRRNYKHEVPQPPLAISPQTKVTRPAKLTNKLQNMLNSPGPLQNQNLRTPCKQIKSPTTLLNRELTLIDPPLARKLKSQLACQTSNQQKSRSSGTYGEARKTREQLVAGLFNWV